MPSRHPIVYLCVAALAGLCPAVAPAHGLERPEALASRAEARPSGGTLPPQGLYEGCAPGAPGRACAARLAEIRSAGFRYVLNYSAWYGSAAEVLRYADVAAGLGLRLIWPLNHPAWRGLADFASTYPDLTGRPPQAIRLVADHPATWGYYIGDELPRREAERVRALSAQARALAPDRPQLYVARPGARQLAPFAGIADVAGVDPYPVGSGDPSVGAAARMARAVTRAAGSRTAMVLQAFSWSQYRPGLQPPEYASAYRLRLMRDAAIHHANPSMILWYSYQDIVRSDDSERRWGALIRAAFVPLTAPVTSKGTTAAAPGHAWDNARE